MTKLCLVVLFLFSLSAHAEDDDVVVRQAAETTDPNVKMTPQGASVCPDCDLAAASNPLVDAKKSSQKIDDFMHFGGKRTYDTSLTPEEQKANAIKKQEEYLNSKDQVQPEKQLLDKNGVSVGGGIKIKPKRKGVRIQYEQEIKN